MGIHPSVLITRSKTRPSTTGRSQIQGKSGRNSSREGIAEMTFDALICHGNPAGSTPVCVTGSGVGL